MTWFFLVAALMVGGAVALLTPSLFQSGRKTANKRRQQNITIARQHMEQVKARLDAQTLSAEEAEQARAEIELTLLEDVGTDDDVDSAQGASGKWAGFVVTALVPVVAGVLYLQLGMPGVIMQDIVAQDFVENEAADEAHSGGDLATVVRQLEQELSDKPDDPESWYLLGNSYMTLNEFGKAAAAFEKLRQLVGDEPDLLVRQADALAMENDGNLSGHPETLIQKALEMQPDHPVALWLAGIAAQRRGDMDSALRYWRLAEPQFTGNPGSLAELRSLIAQAEKMQGGVVAEQATPVVTSELVGVNVTVSLDDSFREKVMASDIVFILAKAVDGPPMPLAVVRKTVGELPMTLVLDDSMAMMENMKLSAFDEVEIVARISKSGMAKAQSGDYFGRTSPVTPGASETVEVVISEQVP